MHSLLHSLSISNNMRSTVGTKAGELPSGPMPHAKTTTDASQIDLTSSNEMEVDTTEAQDQVNPSTALQGCLPVDQQVILSYLSQRVVSCRGPAVQTMRVRPALAHLEEQLTTAITCMANDATSLSVLVLGDPGSGKSLLVERSVAAACSALNTDKKALGVVRLSGLLHLDERVAFMEIARQLCSEFSQTYSKTATFEENLTFLRNMLATLHHHIKSVVFVLDYFEHFARARGKQQLLYNLFDVLQHSKVQAAVIGVTCAQDVMESMEKRVRSRFSHRRMLLTGFTHFEVPAPGAVSKVAQGGPSGGPKKDEDTRPVTLADTPLGVLREILTLPSDGLLQLPAMPVSVGAQQQHAGRQAGASGNSATGPTVGNQLGADVVNKFNASVAAAVADKAVKEGLERLWFLGLSPRALMAVAHRALDAWHQDNSRPGPGTVQPGVMTPAHLLTGVQSQMPATFVNQLNDLSVLQLLLVVGMVRLENKKLATYNFEMVWDECQQWRGPLQFKAEAAWRAFEELVGCNIAYWISVGAEAAGRPMRYAGVCLAVPVSDVAAVMSNAPEHIRRFFHADA